VLRHAPKNRKIARPGRHAFNILVFRLVSTFGGFMRHELKFVGGSHRAALDRIVTFLDSPDPVFLLTSEPGVGKSRVLDELMNHRVFEGDERFAHWFEVRQNRSASEEIADWSIKLLQRTSPFHTDMEWLRRAAGAVPGIGKALELLFRDEKKPALEKAIAALSKIADSIEPHHRLVLVIDPFEDMPEGANAHDLNFLVSRPFKKVKFVFAQRKTDFLANNGKFLHEVGSNSFEVKRLSEEETAETFDDHPGLRRIPADERDAFLAKVGGWPLALDSYGQRLKDTSQTAGIIVAKLPGELESAIKKDHEVLTGLSREVVNTLALVGVPLDSETLAEALEKDPDSVCEAMDGPATAKLIDGKDRPDAAREYGVRHALFADWICSELATRSPKKTKKKGMALAAFFKARFDADFDRTDDLLLAADLWLRAGADRMLLEEAGVISKKLIRRSRFGPALQLSEKQLVAARRSGDRRRESSALHNMANVHQWWGELDEALAICGECLVIERMLGNRAGEGVALSNIALIHEKNGALDEALEMYGENLKVFREVGDRANEATMLNNIALLHKKRGELDKALGMYEESMAIRREVGDRTGGGATRNNIAGIHETRGDLGKALEMYAESLEYSRDVGDRAGESITRSNIASVLEKLGRLGKAIEHMKIAVKIDREVGLPALEKDEAVLKMLEKELAEKKKGGGE
jgi:tetratricopeptide (TPR) repeat protein